MPNEDNGLWQKSVEWGRGDKPGKPPKECGGIQWKEWGYADLSGDWLLGDENRKRVWRGSTAEHQGMPWNGEEKIMGTGCNHHEMMVATKRKSPMNIIHYLVKVISRCF